VLEAVREEMELLAEFEKIEEFATAHQLDAYADAIEACLEQRDEMSAAMHQMSQNFRQRLEDAAAAAGAGGGGAAARR
jgi:hypothetical protein